MGTLRALALMPAYPGATGARHHGGQGVFAELNVTGKCTRAPPVPGEAGVVLPLEAARTELSGPVGSRGRAWPEGSGALRGGPV